MKRFFFVGGFLCLAGIVLSVLQVMKTSVQVSDFRSVLRPVLEKVEADLSNTEEIAKEVRLLGFDHGLAIDADSIVITSERSDYKQTPMDATVYRRNTIEFTGEATFAGFWKSDHNVLVEELVVAGYEKESGRHVAARPAPAPPSVSAALRPGPSGQTRVESAPAPTQTPGTPSLEKRAKQQTSVLALFVTSPDNIKLLGVASPLIASVRSPADRLSVRYVRAAGPEMTVATNEATRLAQLRHPGTGLSVDLSFGDKYTPKDGGSAGAAVALALLSLVEGFDIDERYAMTGDITVDGKLKAVGGIAAKLRGAIQARAKFVVVPKANWSQVTDLMHLYGPDRIWHTQVFAVETLDEARAIARTDRSEDMVKALGYFSQVQVYLKNHPRDYLRNSKIQARLQEVLELAPGHLSAHLMLQESRGRLNQRLSLEATLNRIGEEGNLLLRTLYTNQGYRHSDESARLLTAEIEDLRALMGRADARTHDLLLALIEFGNCVYIYDQFVAKLERRKERYTKLPRNDRRKFEKELGRLEAEEERNAERLEQKARQIAATIEELSKNESVFYAGPHH